MNPPGPNILRLAVLAAVLAVAQTQAQTWITSPSSGDWDTASNWDTSSVPNGASATATFGSSSVTQVTLGSDVVLEGVRFLGGAPAYTLSTGSWDLSLMGVGLADLSSNTQSLSNTGGLFFFNSSTAADASIDNQGSMTFSDTSSAASSSILNSSSLSFLNSATAGSATIMSSSYLAFENSSTAASAVLVNSGYLGFDNSATAGSASVSNALNLYFNDSSTVGSASITNTGTLVFTGSSSAGSASIGNANGLFFDTNASASSATIHNSQEMAFSDSSTAGSAVITNDSIIDFYEGSTAGSAVITNNQNLYFGDDTTAGSSSLTNNGNLYFNGNATAGSAILTTSSTVDFNQDSTAGSALVTIGSGGTVRFLDDAQGGTARFVLTGGSISTGSAAGPVTVGSLEGTGAIYFGLYGITTGSNALSTTFLGTLDNGPSSSGVFTKMGTGTLTLSGANTYAGGTSILAGTLRVVGTGTLGSGTVHTVGTLDLSGHTGSLAVGALSGSGQVSLGGNTLVVGGNGMSTTFLGGLQDGGSSGGTGAALVKVGTGSMVLMGYNTYSGGTQLDGGTLVLDSSLALGSGSVSVNAGTLSFRGTTPFLLQVGGDYLQQGPATLRMGLAGTGFGQRDGVVVTGSAVLGGHLDLVSYGSFTPTVGESFMVLSAIGGLSGRFSSWTNPSGTRWYPIYGSNAMALNAIHPSFEALGTTDNQIAVGAWLDAVYQDQALETFMITQGAQSAAVLRPQFETFAPEELAQTFAAGFSLARDHAGILASRLGRWENGEGGLGTFLEGGLSSEKAEGGTQAPGWDRTSHGMLGGVDFGLGQDAILGILLGYGRTETGLQGGGSVLSSGASGGLFGAWKKEGLRLSGLVEGGLLDHETSRLGDGGVASAKARGPWFSGSVRAGYELGWDGSHILPYVQGQGALVQLDGFSETGSQLPLSFASQGQQSLLTRVGIQASRPWKLGGLSCSAFLDLAWEHLFEGDRPGVAAELPGDTTAFTTRGPVTGTDGLALSGTLNVGFMEGLAAYFRYQGRLAFQALDSQSFAGGVSVGF